MKSKKTITACKSDLKVGDVVALKSHPNFRMVITENADSHCKIECSWVDTEYPRICSDYIHVEALMKASSSWW